MLQEIFSNLWASPVYRIVLYLIMVETALLLLLGVWLALTALKRLFTLARELSFKERLAGNFFTALSDPEALDRWIAKAKRYPRPILRLYLEPRARSTSGHLKEQIADVYERLGLLEADVRQARSRFWLRRIQAMRRLTFLARPEHAELLAERGKDLHPIRVLAALALGRVGSADQVLVALRDLELPRRLMEQPVFTMLESMEHRRFVEVASRWRDIRSGQIRRIVLEVAAHRTPELCRELLPGARSSASLEVRIGAARAAGELQTPDSLRDLLFLLKDSAPEVRAQAARSLGARGDGAALENLSQALQDESFWVRQNAAAALRSLGAAGLQQLQEVKQKSKDRFARDAARQELERQQIFLQAGELVQS